MEDSVKEHFGRIKTRLSKGGARIRKMVAAGEPFQTADIPFVKPDKTFVGRKPPQDGDKCVFPQAPSRPIFIHAFWYLDSTSQPMNGRPKVSNTFAHTAVS